MTFDFLPLPAIAAWVAASCLLAALCLWFHQVYGRRYLVYWALAWFSNAAYQVASVGAAYWSSSPGAIAAAAWGASAVAQTAGYWHIAWLVAGTYEVHANRVVSPSRLRLWLAGLSVLGILVATTSANWELPSRLLAQVGLRSAVLAVAAFGVAAVLFVSRKPRDLGRPLMALAMALYGVQHLEYVTGAVLMVTRSVGGIEDVLLSGNLDAVLQAFIGMAMAVWLLDEERLRVEARDRRISSMLESAPDLVAWLDPDGTFLVVSAAFHGMKAKDLVGRRLLDLVLDADRRDVEAAMVKAIATGQVARTACRGTPIHGHSPNYLVHLGPVVDEGVVQALTLIVSDITERVAAETARLETERLHRTLLDNVLVGVFVVRGMRFLHVNPKMTDIFGYTSAEFRVLSSVLDLLHPDDVERAAARIDERQRGVDLRDVTRYRCRHKQGHEVTVEVHATPIEYQGEPALIGAVLDVTERVRTEEQLRHAQKLEAVGQLTGGVAHDFNNLLGVVIGNLDLLRDSVSPGRAETAAIVDDAMDAALRAGDLTRRLLTFARRQVLRPEVVDVATLVEGVTRLVSRTLGEDIAVETTVPDSLPPVHVDGHELETVLLNLAVNARDAMPDGGTVTIEAGEIRLEGEAARRNEVEPGWFVTLRVADTGHGMPEDVRSRAFEPFFTTKPAGRGTGLGLSMVYGFVRQSRGYVTLTSEVDRGTVVELGFPAAARSAAMAVGGQGSRTRTGRGERVLVVEDQDDLRRLVAALLLSLGYRVVEAGGAEEAFESVAREPVDLLLTDVVLPGGVSGFELARRLEPENPGLKVLYMTGDPTRIVSDGRGPNAPVLRKPFRRKELAEVMRGALDTTA